MSKHLIDIRVYYEDTDAGGIVYNANYLKYMERARTEWLRKLGMLSSQLQKDYGLTFVVAAIEIRYKKPAYLDDMLQAEVVVESVNKARLYIRQNIYRDGEVVAEANCEMAMLDMDKQKGVRIPDHIAEVLLA